MIQKERPGWRFSLLGGSTSYGYKRSKSGKIVGVNKKEKIFFGWQAEFFGSINPTKCTGGRHVSTAHYERPEDAIVVACH